jgi:hypothetical protein
MSMSYLESAMELHRSSHINAIFEKQEDNKHSGLQECSAPNNKDLSSRQVQAEILASMPNPHGDMEGDEQVEDG